MLARINQSSKDGQVATNTSKVSTSIEENTTAKNQDNPSMFHEFGADTLLRDGSFDKIISEGSSKSVSRDARRFAHLKELHTAIDFTKTRLGSAALVCDIMRPPTELHDVQARREAILELHSNHSFRDALNKALAATQKEYFTSCSMEESSLRFFVPGADAEINDKMNAVEGIKLLFFSLLNSERPLMYRLKAVGEILKLFSDLPMPESALLREHISTIQAVLSSDESALLRGAICRTWGDIESRARVPWWKPAFSSNSQFINPEAMLLNLAVAAPSWMAAMSTLSNNAQVVPINAGSFISPVLAAGQFITSFARLMKMNFGFPAILRQRISAIDKIGEALDAIGKLDSLLSLSTLPERFGADGCFPDLVKGERFSMRCSSIHNPVLYLQGSSIANDFECVGGIPRLLTGPNSGGKTTLVTSIFQNQILAQLGTAVPARHYEATVADKFVFQGPSFAALDEHGRFGTELIATREAFLQATARSLVVLDEVGDGTTAEERNDFAAAVIWGFSKIKCGVLLVTHNISLADRLSKEGVAEVYQMEFDQINPTFKVKPGISRCSNAERVARALRFAPEDIDRILLERGYLPPPIPEAPAILGNG